MNRIESQFAPIRCFVLKSSYFKNHKELDQNIKEYLKWRNSNRHNSLLKMRKRKHMLSNKALATNNEIESRIKYGNK